jgi:hypothetical protein
MEKARVASVVKNFVAKYVPKEGHSKIEGEVIQTNKKRLARETVELETAQASAAELYFTMNSAELKSQQGHIVLSQNELTKALRGGSFRWCCTYSTLLTTIFVALTYGTGLPCLYWVAMVQFALIYFAEKYVVDSFICHLS